MRTQPERGSILIDLIKYKYQNGIADTLNKMNLKIEKGEFVGLMGRTGAGKTTTLMLLNGLIPHFFEGEFEGEIIANTMNTARYRIQTLARFIGLVTQDPETQIFGITVEKDVAFGPSNLAYGREKIKELVEKSLASVGLKGYEKRITTELSGGEKQRLTIAGVLAMEPEILVLDEPTSELDPAGRREIYKLLSNLRKENNVTILISGHDSEEMLEFTDRIVALDKGSVIWDGKPSSLFADLELLDTLGIRPPEAAEISNCLIKENIFSSKSVFINNDELVKHCTAEYKFVKNTGLPDIKPETTDKGKIVVEAKNLCFGYSNDKHVLQNINIKISQGEFVALIGKNGAGKTTFSKHLNGLYRPVEGEVLINGKNIRGVSVPELSREVGYVFQNPDHQIFDATVWEEVEFGLKNLPISGDERNRRIADALEFVGLDKFKERHPFMLGKGERQKLAVASILAMEPKILVIDEPTTGQDWDGTKRMMAMMEKLHRMGHTIIAITHNMRLAAEYAGRIIVFSKGNVVLDGTPEKVFYQQEILKSAAVTPPDSVLIGNQLRICGLDKFPVTVNDIQSLFINKEGIV